MQQRLHTDANYSIASSAREISAGGMVTPIALAVFRLKTNSNAVGYSTDRSAGFAPLGIASIRRDCALVGRRQCVALFGLIGKLLLGNSRLLGTAGRVRARIGGLCRRLSMQLGHDLCRQTPRRILKRSLVLFASIGVADPFNHGLGIHYHEGRD